MTEYARAAPAARATGERLPAPRRPAVVARQPAAQDACAPAQVAARGTARHDDQLGVLLARAVAGRRGGPHPATAAARRGAVRGPLLQRAKKTIVQHGEMSGDMFQIAVALLADAEVHLYLIGANAPGPRDKAQQIYDFYVKATGIPAERVHLEKIDGDPSKQTKQILHGMVDPRWKNPTVSVGDATNILRERFRADVKLPPDDRLPKKVREAWIGSSGVTYDWIDKLIKQRAIPLEDPMVVLWSRQSGALGGLHPDLDSSYTGMGQLATRFADEGYTVVIVGDDPQRKIVAKRLKDDKIVAEREAYERAIRLGEFWSTDLRGKARTAQFQFFERLRQLVPTLTHVGMRSGNLEAYAYMGHRVLFLEERDRPDAIRMQKLVGLDTVLKYRTVKLEELPTRTGKVLMEAPTLPMTQQGHAPKPDISEDRRFAHRHSVDAMLAKLANWKKTYDNATGPKANSRMKSAKEKLDKELTDSDHALLAAFRVFVEQNKHTAPHQQRLKAYQWLKSQNRNLVPSAAAKGFTDSDVDAIVETTKGNMGARDPRGGFWCVSVPESHLGKFFEHLEGLREPGAKGIGTDGATYVLAAVRREWDRSGSAQTGISITSTDLYDFVRQPDVYEL